MEFLTALNQDVEIMIRPRAGGVRQPVKIIVADRSR